ncbi:hypothetical protein N1851_009501 [Merluccius polli]|uniref:Uncharacterized protein n=1 Tax=Merluccius polli TaxID=89951 RepID=A0AA47N141_MERPO|nr:hypothetical protein N1851_009501 [Merluccius polli]
MLTLKRKWRICQRRKLGRKHNPEHDASSSEDVIPQAKRETFLSKNGTIKRSSVAYHKQGRMAEHKVMEMTLTFYLFITPVMEEIILEMTNLEGFRT